MYQEAPGCFLTLTFCITGYRWPLPSKLCAVWIYLDVLFSTASIMHLCAISLDRYVAIQNPIHHSRFNSRTKAFLKIIAVWTISVGEWKWIPLTLTRLYALSRDLPCFVALKPDVVNVLLTQGMSQPSSSHRRFRKEPTWITACQYEFALLCIERNTSRVKIREGNTVLPSQLPRSQIRDFSKNSIFHHQWTCDQCQDTDSILKKLTCFKI